MRETQIVDLFAGPGGFDVAAHWLGIPVVGIEVDQNACATRRAAGLETEEGDVRTFAPEKFPDATVLVGGPPCQTYTVAGAGAGRRALDRVLEFARRMGEGEDVTDDLAGLEDERTGLVLEPLRWALQAHKTGRPYEAVVLEQVPAVLPVWKAFGKVFHDLGYSVGHRVLHAEEYGVPQTRRRAILIATRDRDASLPEPTHHRYRKDETPQEPLGGLSAWVPMKDVIRRGAGFKVVSNYGTGGDPKARGTRTSLQPAATVTGKVSRNRLLSLDGERPLHRFTISEMGLLQTFPGNYPWRGRDVSQQIGNAIPPLLAMHVLGATLGFDHQALKAVVEKIPDRWPLPTQSGLDNVARD